MGTPNNLTKTFISKKHIFSDICNGFLYHGKQVIQPEQLHPLDPDYVALILEQETKSKTENLTTKAKKRDILKSVSAMATDNAAYLIIGIEHQQNIHYAMPVRNMMYDAMEYERQLQEITEAHRNNKEYEAFTSGFQKKDELLPVITIVVYLGSKPWDGPMSLHDMMPSTPQELLKYVANYPLHLIDPHRMDEEELQQFQTNAREIFHFIKHARDKNKILELVQEPRYQALDPLAAQIINECTNSRLPLHLTHKEDISMCQAIDEIREDSRNEGIEIGISKERKEMAVSLLKENVFTNDKIAELTKLPLEEIEALQKAI